MEFKRCIKWSPVFDKFGKQQVIRILVWQQKQQSFITIYNDHFFSSRNIILYQNSVWKK